MDFAQRFGPYALVTGASSGIGEQFARQLAARGLNLVVTARRASRLDSLADDLRSTHGIEVTVIPIDLADPAAAARLVEQCGALDIGLVVSNAGAGLKGAHHNQPVDEIIGLVAVNCIAPAILARGFAPTLMRRGRGGLLLVGSIESVGGFPWSAVYSASKAFVDALGEGLWGELRTHGVDVFVVAPGATATEIHERQGIDTAVLTGVMSAEEVARRSLEHLGRRSHYTVGALNKTLVGLLRALPRSLRIRAAGMGMRRTLERSGNQRL